MNYPKVTEYIYLQEQLESFYKKKYLSAADKSAIDKIEEKQVALLLNEVELRVLRTEMHLKNQVNKPDGV